jgi:type IV pilus assembly protein PilZ
MDATRERILHLDLSNRTELYAAYLPFIRGGGLFVPTRADHPLGDELFLVVQLPEEPEALPVTGRVIWRTPPGAAGHRPAGIGLQLQGDDHGTIRARIEDLLAGALASDRPTHTL